MRLTVATILINYDWRRILWLQSFLSYDILKIMDDIQKIEHYVLSIISMLIVAIMSIGLVIQSSFYFGISWFGIMMTLCSCCIILDANTTLRSLCCSLFSIGAIIPIFVANCWWGAAVIPVAIVFWGIKRRSLSLSNTHKTD